MHFVWTTIESSQLENVIDFPFEFIEKKTEVFVFEDFEDVKNIDIEEFEK